MEKSEKKIGVVLPVGTLFTGEVETQVRTALLGLSKDLTGFKIRSFPEESLERNRPDHPERLAAMEVAVRRSKKAADQALSSSLDRDSMIEYFEAMLAYFDASNALYCPESRAWVRLFLVLREAKQHPEISTNPEVLKFVDCVVALVHQAGGHLDHKGVLKPLENRLRSDHARQVASQKNEEPRAWVRSAWRDRSDKGQSKAAFARQHAALVKRRFDVDVTPDTIGRDWLPKGKDPAA
jgi:hypothetical protein